MAISIGWEEIKAFCDKGNGGTRRWGGEKTAPEKRLKLLADFRGSRISQTVIENSCDSFDSVHRTLALSKLKPLSSNVYIETVASPTPPPPLSSIEYMK